MDSNGCAYPPFPTHVAASGKNDCCWYKMRAWLPCLHEGFDSVPPVPFLSRKGPRALSLGTPLNSRNFTFPFCTLILA